MTTPDAPATRPEQFGFLRDAHDGPLIWKGLCLSLARKAPGLPAVYPSALAAMEATPHDRRYPLKDARRGMVAFWDDPHDSNPFAHVTTVAGWDEKPTTDPDDLLNWTNDAVRTGGVDLVRGSFFPARWGDGFKFATDWLNGYDLPGYDSDEAPTPAPGRESIGANLDHAIADIRRALRHHRRKGHTARVNALAKDLRELKETRRLFP